MDFKVSISCKDCGCAFELRGQHISTATSLCCPNCFHDFPQEVFENLKIGIVNLSRVPSKISLDNDSFWGYEGFELAVKEIPADDGFLQLLNQSAFTEENEKN